ncbi:MAG: class I tRNA ligase family protein, partial [candidate division WOR-3 bacterium]
WTDFQGHSPHRPWIDKVKIKCEKCGNPISRIPDVGNPWLDAGIVPFSTMRPPDDMHTIANGYPHDKSYWQEWFPADFISESLPGQFRNWFYAILTMSTVLENRPPFKVLQGYASLRDERGEEMHKSKGNAIWSDEAAEKVGADVMRWMFAKHNPIQNLNFGYGAAKEIKRVLLTLWNVYSFFVTYANIDDFNPAGKTIQEGNLTKLDRWVLARLNSLIAQCDAAYEDVNLINVVQFVERFFDDLSNWYVRRSRRRFWKSENDADKETAYLILYECLVKIIKVIAPIMPFWTEEMYQNLIVSVEQDAPHSIHLCAFPDADDGRMDRALEDEIALTRSIVSLGRAARNKVNIKIRQPLGTMVINLAKDSPELSEDDRAIILEELNIKKISTISLNALDEILTYRITPNFSQLGPKYGKSLDTVVGWIKKMNQNDIEKLITTGRMKKEINGINFEITNDDVEIQRIERENFTVASEEQLGVAIDITLSEDLECEGLVRELIHKIQLMRKEADFQLVDRIRIVFATESKLQQAIIKNLDYLKSETLASEVVEGTPSGEVVKDLNINGIPASISLQRLAIS